MNNFIEDLRTGRKQEIRFANWYKRTSGDSVTNFTFYRDHRFDLSVEYKNKPYSFEIKSDHFSKDEKVFRNIVVPGDDWRTLFIEFECSGKPSGISSTEADYWVHVMTLMDQIWIIPVKKLRQIIFKNKFDIKEGGDGKRVSGILLPRDLYVQEFKVHDDHNPDFIFKDEFIIDGEN